MKKNYFLCILFFMLFSSGISSQISTLPWTETFEDDSTTRADWGQIYETNTMSWTFVSSPTTGSYIGNGSTAYEGSKFANYPANSHNFDKTKLISPILNLSSYTDLKLSFYYRNPLWSPDQNWLRVFYRISESDSWIQIMEFHSDVINWTYSELIAIPNNVYQIAIECETDYGYSTTVDALTIQGVELSNTNFFKTSFNCYPNPVNDILNFNCSEQITTISVYSLLGQKINEIPVNASQSSIDLSNLKRGNYILKAITENNIITHPIIKK